MGFDFGDVWNPLEQIKDLWNGGSSALGNTGGGTGTYANVRGPDGRPVQMVTPYGKLLSQQTGLAAPVDVADPTRQALLAQQGGLAGQFADQAQTGYNAYGQQAQGALAALQRQASGQDSVSAMQLRQALGQQLAQQRSFAAGASPRNAAGAARTAAIQMGRASTAAAGQQAVAGQAERNAANQQYGQLVGQLRGQDLSAATQSRQNALGGYGAPNTGVAQPSWIQQYGPAIAGGAAAAASDRRLKTDLGPGDDKANAAIDALRPYAYRYKDPQQYGTGPQLGTTTQDLSRAGLGQAVVKTPAGEMVDPGKLSGANTAMIAALGRRVAELEGQSPAERYDKSPLGQRQERMDLVREGDPRAYAAQQALDHRRSLLQEVDLRRAGAYPGGFRPLPSDEYWQTPGQRHAAALAALRRAGALVDNGGE
ncbi:MAG: tail fiber domain-containing protein [Mycobacteriales bacterium]|nr:tail fiber domain-containing protein [Actinomycetota bacterium]